MNLGDDQSSSFEELVASGPAAAAQRENTLNYLDALAVEASIANAVRQRAMNQGRSLLTAQDIALQRVMSALVDISPLPTAKADVDRLVQFEALLRGRS